MSLEKLAQVTALTNALDEISLSDIPEILEALLFIATSKKEKQRRSGRPDYENKEWEWSEIEDALREALEKIGDIG